MACLSETLKMAILMMIRFSHKSRIQQNVCDLFNNKYPDRAIKQSTVRKVENEFQ